MFCLWFHGFLLRQRVFVNDNSLAITKKKGTTYILEPSIPRPVLQSRSYAMCVSYSLYCVFCGEKVVNNIKRFQFTSICYKDVMMYIKIIANKLVDDFGFLKHHQ